MPPLDGFDQSAPPRTPRAAFWIVGVVVLVAGLASAGIIRAQEERNARDRTEAALRSVGDATSRFVSSSLAAVGGAGATVDASGQVSRARLEAFSANLSRVSPLNATASVDVVAAQDRAAYEAELGRPIMDLDGGDVSPAGEREQYWVVDQVVPENQTISLLVGLDIAANEISGEPARDARDDGRSRITQAIVVPSELAGLGGERDEDLSIFFVIKPIYDLSTPTDTVEQRRSAHRGFVVSALSGAQLAEDVAAAAPEGVQVRVTDGEVVLAGSARPEGDVVTEEQSAGGRRWAVEIVDTRTADHGLAIVVLVVTLLLVAGLAVALRRDRRHERHRRRVDTMLSSTAELARRLSAAGSVDQVAAVIDADLPATLGVQAARFRLVDDQHAAERVGTDRRELADRPDDTHRPDIALDPTGTAIAAVVELDWPERSRLDELTSSTLATVTELCEQALARADATDRATRQAGALAELAEHLAAAHDVDTVVSTVLGSARGPVRAAAVSIGLIDQERQVLSVRHGDTVDESFGSRFASPSLSEPLAFTDAARTGRPVLVPDIADYDRRYPDTDRSHVSLGEGARAAMPLLIDGTSIGAIVFAWDQARTFDDELLFSLTTIAELTSQAVHRARLSAMHLHDARRSRALADLAQGLAHCDGLEQLASYVVDHVGDPIGVGRAALLVDDGVRWRGWSSPTLATHPELRRQLIGSPDAPSGRLREVADREATDEIGPDDGAYVALRHRSGEALGALWLGWDGDRPGDPELDDVISTVAGMVEQAVGRTVSADQLRVDWDRSERLADFARRLAGVHTVDDLVHAVVAHANEPAGAALASIGLLDESATILEVAPSPSFDPEGHDAFRTCRRSDQLPGPDAIRDAAPVLLHTRDEAAARYPDRIADAIERHGLHASAHFPLIAADGQALGWLGFAWATEQRFPPSKLARLRTLAELCTQTLQRARLGDAEHRLVDSLHDRVVGRTPRFADLALSTRYLPSTHEVGMGGDWYDALTLDEHSFAVIVGDVAGHGISAVADMLELRAVIRALLQHHVPLEMVFELVSSSWLEGNDSLATACISVIDTQLEVVRHVSAGHIPALVRLPDATVVTLDGGRQPVLGVPGREVVPHEQSFPPGSVLVMCTDGLIERRTRTIDVSIDDLVRVVGALDVGTDTDQMSDAILSECLTGTEQKDDVALVVVRRDLVDEAPRSPAPPTTRHERRFEPTRAAVSAAREFSAVAAGVSGTDRDDVELITSELVTNATLHGTGEVIVRIERGSSLIRIEVFDDGSDTPLRRHPEPHEEGGRGLGIVEMIADGWGVTHDTSGKWVWAELELSEGG